MQKIIDNSVTHGVLASSAGGAINSLFIVGDGDAFLYLLGVIMSLIALGHNETNVNRSKNKAELGFKTLRYVAIGVFTFPSTFVYAGSHFWEYTPFKALVATAATFSIVYLYDAWVRGKVKKLEE